MLKENKMRMTRQRKIILEELRKVNTHPSADEIYEMVRLRLPRISLGTVYRNLEILSELGEIQKLRLSGALKRFDWDTSKHYHIRCVRCNRVDDAPIAPLNQIEDELYESTVFEIIGHNLEFVGLCPECSKKLAKLTQKNHLLCHMSHDTSMYHASNMRRFFDFVLYVFHITIFYEQVNPDLIILRFPVIPKICTKYS